METLLGLFKTMLRFLFAQWGTAFTVPSRAPAGPSAGGAPAQGARQTQPLAMPAELCSAPSVPRACFRQVSSQEGYVSLNSTPTFPRVYKLVLPYQVVGKSYVRMKISSYRLRTKHHIHPFILKLHHVNHFAIYVTLASL